MALASSSQVSLEVTPAACLERRRTLTEKHALAKIMMPDGAKR